MKNIRFLLALLASSLSIGFIVVVTVFSRPLLAQTQTAPDLGKGVVIGTIADVNSFTIEVVLYEKIGVVCIHHRSLQYSRNCWDVDTAPKKIQELIRKK